MVVCLKTLLANVYTTQFIGREMNVAHDLRDGFDHVEPHLHTAVGVVCSRLWESAHAVVTVTQDLDSQAVVLLCYLIKPELKQ